MNKWQAVVLVFLIALGIRLATLNQMGRTWDEGAYVEHGYEYVQLLQKGDFKNPYWYLQSDHPPLSRYLFGIASIFSIEKIEKNGNVIFEYNFLWPRIISVLLGSLSAFFIVLIGYKFYSPYVGIASGLIFSLIPFFVGLSQIATLESSIIFFFTACVYFYLEFINFGKKKYIFLTGVTLGFALLVKQSNGLLIPLLGLIYTVWYLFQRKRNFRKFISLGLYSFFMIGVSSFLTIFLLWPMLFFNIQEVLNVQNAMWVKNVQLPPPEVFFGRLMLVPFPYYFVMFLITTPLVTLVLFAVGALAIDKKRNFISISILIWFLFPFVQSFYPFKQHGLRYIVELYAPFALICGIGLEYFNSKFLKEKRLQYYSLAFVSMSLLGILYKQQPYYLDYFNEVVGGSRNVYEKKLFQMGWWGQGIGEAAHYISSHEKKLVTVAVDGTQPATVMPRLKNINLVYYDKNKTADYVISPYFNIVRLGFPEHELDSKYKVVYTVYANGAKLVKVYKRIQK